MQHDKKKSSGNVKIADMQCSLNCQIPAQTTQKRETPGDYWQVQGPLNFCRVGSFPPQGLKNFEIRQYT